jgi:hypothetical protein
LFKSEKWFLQLSKTIKIIEIFKKLLAISSVAASFLVSLKCCDNPPGTIYFDCINIFCDRENKATSAPETNPKQNSKTTIPMPNTRFTSIA